MGENAVTGGFQEEARNVLPVWLAERGRAQHTVLEGDLSLDNQDWWRPSVKLCGCGMGGGVTCILESHTVAITDSVLLY